MNESESLVLPLHHSALLNSIMRIKCVNIGYYSTCASDCQYLIFEFMQGMTFLGTVNCQSKCRDSLISYCV